MIVQQKWNIHFVFTIHQFKPNTYKLFMIMFPSYSQGYTRLNEIKTLGMNQ